MIYLVFTFIGTYFIELFFRGIILEMQWKRGIKQFERNKEFIINLDLYNYKIESGHIYE